MATLQGVDDGTALKRTIIKSGTRLFVLYMFLSRHERAPRHLLRILVFAMVSRVSIRLVLTAVRKTRPLSEKPGKMPGSDAHRLTVQIGMF
ncbi:MAG: hypothetical protein WA418_10565 [Bradyrhizobium sp.]